MEIGATLGAYKVVAKLGEGGMGEVYRALDTRLDRTVAIKVVLDWANARPDLRQRFAREARAVSSLNHPRICTLYDVGHHDGIDFLVIELVEGETLAARLARGAVPLPDALDIARQVADALDHAHRRGVTHRDLKPSNVMLTKGGVKLLDFGLAKMRPVSAPDDLATKPMQAGPLTAHGTLLGTLHYMAPEQLEGREADARADLFAFGALFYEMVTARRAFDGKSPASVIAAILGSEPLPVSTVQPQVPAAVEGIIRGCLAKDPEDRWQDARDLRRALDAAADESRRTLPLSPGDSVNEQTEAGSARALARAPNPGLSRAALVVGVAALGLGVALTVRSSLLSTAPTRVVRSVIPIAPAEELSWGGRSTSSPLLGISPDGNRLVYSGSRGGVQRLYLRELHGTEAVAIPGTEGGIGPFFSPDGRWLGFVAGSEVKKAALTGGAPLTLCSNCGLMGHSWGREDSMVAGYGRGGLQRVPAAGGPASQLTAADKEMGERTLRFPELLPGGQAVVFTAGGWNGDTFDDARIEALSLATGRKKVLIEGGTYARYASTGHLVYARDGALFAVAFDPVRLEVTGAPVAVLAGVATSRSNGAAQFALSDEGTLVYAPGRSMSIHHRLVWIDRQGKVEPAAAIDGAFLRPRLSPAGDRIALGVNDALAYLAVYDLQLGALTRLTSEENVPPGLFAWAPDGSRLAYTWARTGEPRIYRQPADGSGPAEEIGQGFAGSWSPDGKTLAFERSDPGTQADVWLLTVGGDGTPRAFLQERANQRSPEISPDGRWIAYVSDESGRTEVFVREFPGRGQKKQISANGGDDPRWSRDGDAIFYIEGQRRLMVAQIRARPALAVSKAAIAFEDKERRYLKHGYDVAPDGRFLLVDENEIWPTQLNLVQNFLEEVKRLVPR
jgi:serine/threonine-protein kinase